MRFTWFQVFQITCNAKVRVDLIEDKGQSFVTRWLGIVNDKKWGNKFWRFQVSFVSYITGSNACWGICNPPHPFSFSCVTNSQESKSFETNEPSGEKLFLRNRSSVIVMPRIFIIPLKESFDFQTLPLPIFWKKSFSKRWCIDLLQIVNYFLKENDKFLRIILA